MTKEEAEEVVLSRWRRRPEFRRQSVGDATAFVVECRDILFETLGNRESIILAWVVRELRRDGWLDLAPKVPPRWRAR